MSGHQAKIITDPMFRQLLDHVRRSATPERDEVILLLSVKAGLRACEIAGLEWTMVLDARGEVGRSLALEDRVAKRGSGRRVPLHTDLQLALNALMKQHGSKGPVIRSSRGGAMRANSIVNWFALRFDELGFNGCSSHSGRRTFITRAARSVHQAGGCLRDVQLLAGHRSLSVTQGYIDGDTDAQPRLVALI